MSQVSETYRLCHSMVSILYEELYRFLFLNFLEEYTNSNEGREFTFESNTDYNSFVIELCEKFEIFIDEKIKRTKDDYWKYACCFYKLFSLYKLYTTSMKSGDAVAMEYIETNFCGIFHLMKKHKYVEIVLNQMEKKYLNISYSQLQEIRMNCSCRYEQNIPTKNIYYPMHVLDEVMENVNMWVKELPVHQDDESWTVHSPNVTFARRSITFEKMSTSVAL